MKFKSITPSTVYTCVSEDGTRYERLGDGNWGQWMGESLEIENHNNAELEAAFQAEKIHQIELVNAEQWNLFLTSNEPLKPDIHPPNLF